MNRLDILKNSLEKKQILLNNAYQEDHNFVISKAGEPLGNNANYLKKIEQMDNKIKNLETSIQKTKLAIEKEELKAKGLNYLGRIISSVDNIEKLTEKANNSSTGGNKSYYLKKAKELKQIKEKADNQILSKKTQELLDEGKVVRWVKKPVFFFVKGFKKAGLVLKSTGDIYPSQVYKISTEDKIKIQDYLGLSFADILESHKKNINKG